VKGSDCLKDTIKFMKALSDEIRVRIVNLLFHSDLYVCEIVDVLKLPQSTVSRHLTILKNANIVKDNKDGLWIKYSLIKDKKHSMIENIVTNELVNDEKCINDLARLNNRMKFDRGCKKRYKEMS
jgi:DNA-binding transcriptional ArsR family regulator